MPPCRFEMNRITVAIVTKLSYDCHANLSELIIRVQPARSTCNLSVDDTKRAGYGR